MNVSWKGKTWVGGTLVEAEATPEFMTLTMDEN